MKFIKPVIILIGAFLASLLNAVPPNILFILVDDLGWQELGCYGDDFFDTPNIDRLASEGMLFTDAYAPAPICSASRESFLTGRTPARTGFEFVVKNPNTKPLIGNTRLLPPSFTENMPLEEVTIAELLKETGYRTGMVGKWHLNAHHGGYLGLDPTFGPANQGFEYVSSDFGAHPYGYKDREFGDYAEGQFPEDRMTQDAIDFLEKQDDRPFFLYYSSFYPHEPVHTQCEWLYDKYAAKPGADGSAGDRAMYGAFVEQMDHYIGQLLDALDRLDLRNNTLVVFTSDNGNSPMYQFRNMLRGGKWDLYEGGIRVPMIVRWPGKVEARSRCNVPVHGVDLLPTFCEAAKAPVPKALELDGESLIPVFKNYSDGRQTERSLYWHFPYYHPRTNITRPQSAIRRGPWKLIYYHEDKTCRLYNVVEDIGERNDLRGVQPDLVDELRVDLLNYLITSDARMPMPNKAYDKSEGWNFN